jgi:hypothetical protein
MKSQSRSWLYVRVSAAALLALLVVGLVAESPATATTTPTTSVLVPANAASVSGITTLDAAATNATGVAFYLFGGSYYGLLVGSATPTEYGWIYEWNTSTVPNGSYELFSKATGSGGSAVSSGVSVTVDNVLHTQVLVPSAAATVGGNVILDASAEGTARVTGVTFTATQGSTVETVGTATPTLYGWIAQWDAGASAGSPPSPSYPNGTWSIQSVATEVGGTTATSSPILITLVTLADLVSSSSFPIAPGGVPGCTDILANFTGTYPGSTSVGNVNLAVDGCVGGFTLTTDVGSVSGSAGIAGGMGDLWALQVTSGTGLFTGTTGGTLTFFVNLGLNDSGPYTGSVGLFT